KDNTRRRRDARTAHNPTISARSSAAATVRQPGASPATDEDTLVHFVLETRDQIGWQFANFGRDRIEVECQLWVLRSWVRRRKPRNQAVVSNGLRFTVVFER